MAANPMIYMEEKPPAFKTGVYNLPKYLAWKPGAKSISDISETISIPAYMSQQKSMNFAEYVYAPQEGPYRGKLSALVGGPAQPYKSTEATDLSSIKAIDKEQARAHLLRYLATKGAHCSDASGRGCTIESVEVIPCFVVKTETYIEIRSRVEQHNCRYFYVYPMNSTTGVGPNDNTEGRSFHQNLWDVKWGGQVSTCLAHKIKSSVFRYVLITILI